MDGRYVAVIGPSEASDDEMVQAEAVGRLLAESGAVVVCGGLGGVMEGRRAVARRRRVGRWSGCCRAPIAPPPIRHVTVAIATGMGEMRNVLIVRAADVVLAVGGAYGTLSEIALALRTGVPVVGVGTWSLDDVVDAPDPVAAVALALALAAE